MLLDECKLRHHQIQCHGKKQLLRLPRFFPHSVQCLLEKDPFMGSMLINNDQPPFNLCEDIRVM